MKRILIYWSLVFIIGLNLFSIDVLKKDEILLKQDDILIQRILSFCVIKGERFLVVDFKAKDIKLFDKNGSFIEVWGKQGYGPLEFGKPFLIDYREPYLAIMDLGKRKFMVYSDEENPHFSMVTEFMNPAMGFDLRVMSERLMISGYKRNNEGKAYELYLYNFLTKKIDFLIPIEEKYGYKSFNQYESRYDKELKALSDDAYCALYNNFVYYAWTGDIRVIRMDLKTREKLIFGHKTKNFIKPEMTKKMLEMQQSGSSKTYLEYRKFSFISGIFTDKDFVGVLYCNFHEYKPGWQNYIQFYTLDGDFIEEKELKGGVNNENYPNKAIYYNQKKHTLYFLSQTIDKDLNDIYHIIKYEFNISG